MMHIDEFATLRDVKVFKPGTHNGEAYTPTEVEAMIADSNECAEYIKTSIEAGIYDGNDFDLEKPIPGLLNIEHQKYLPDTIKQAVKDISVEYQRQGDWVTATFYNVKDEIAKFLQAGFPFRSVEIVKHLKNTLNGKTYNNILRSVGFLQANPAVPQEPGYAVEFASQADAPVIMLYSQTEEPQQGDTMEPIVKEEAQGINIPAAVETPPAVSIEEYDALTARQAEQDKTIKEMQDDMKRAEAENVEMKTRLDSARQEQDAQSITMYCDKLIHEQEASPSFIGLIMPHLIHADHSAVVEFSAEQHATRREALQTLFAEVVEMSKKSTITVPVGAALKPDHADPIEEKESPLQQQERCVAEFAGKAKSQATNPHDEQEVYGIALKLAVAEHPELF